MNEIFGMKMSNLLFQPISKIVKLSDFLYKLIKKCCSGDRVIDVLFHFPISILNRVSDIKNFSEKDKLTLIVKVIEHFAPRFRSSPYKIMCLSGDEAVTIVYFNYNAAMLRRTFPINEVLTISGNAQRGVDGVQMVHPDVVTRQELFKYHLGPEPVYPLTAKLSNRTMNFIVHSLLKTNLSVPEWIPENFLKKYALPSFADAIRSIHNPKNINDINPTNTARKRIAIDELLANQIRFRQLRESNNEQHRSHLRPNGTITGRLMLPFELTADQSKCLDDIKRDLMSGKPMNRLIQGDVGSGKTIVSFISMLISIENGMQAALLAPTEILALQHFKNIERMSVDLGINIDIMLSSNRKFRDNQRERLKSGETQLLIGTHAILEDNVEFKNLGLIVIDEQHRFGVLQRLRLIEKCNNPNILAMSATPIPRTLLLGCYGDLDVSTIKTKPAGRKPVETIVINVSKIDDLITRLKDIDSQIYWVCPVIEESDTLIDVSTRCSYLNKVFSEKNVRVLHGKMKPKEKEEIMTSFKRKEFNVLVSTTVIEVGVDIPTANVIVIEHAERFGLAQLHQLRGRVGRGNEAAYCILLYHYPISNVGKQRLQLLKNTSDGFILSEEDLKLRGAGDILGRDQSGFNALKFSDFSDNSELIKIANEIAASIDIYSAETSLLCEIFNRLDNDIIA